MKYFWWLKNIFFTVILRMLQCQKKKKKVLTYVEWFNRMSRITTEWGRCTWPCDRARRVFSLLSPLWPPALFPPKNLLRSIVFVFIICENEFFSQFQLSSGQTCSPRLKWTLQRVLDWGLGAVKFLGKKIQNLQNASNAPAATCWTIFFLFREIFGR